MEVYGWVRMINYNRKPGTQFRNDHPEFYLRMFQEKCAIFVK